MTESPEELAAVEQLLAESDALRGWLGRLDHASGSIPDAVRQRVRDDYQHRLDQVTAGLRAHADVIAGKLLADRSERADLDARAGAAREALAEAELRHAVGEYDGGRFDNERRRHTSDIETYQLAIDAVIERVARLEQVQSLVNRAPIQLALDAPLEVELQADASATVPEVHAFTVEQMETIGIADLAPDADEVLAIFDEPREPGHSAPSGAGTTATPENGPLSFRPSGSVDSPRQPTAQPARPVTFDSAPPLGIPTADVPPRFIRPGDRLGPRPAQPVVPAFAPEPPAPRRIEGEGPTGAASDGTTAPVGRTLRCGECGAMNRPLEWYCEKCGAELTAV